MWKSISLSTKVSALFGIGAFLLTTVIPFIDLLHQEITKEFFVIYVFVSIISCGAIVLPLLFEKLDRINEIQLALKEIQQSTRKDLKDLKNILDSVRLLNNGIFPDDLERSLKMTKKYIETFYNFKSLIFLHLNRSFSSWLQEMRENKTSSLIFPLNRNDEALNREVWKKYIECATECFFGVQYRFAENTLGGSQQDTLLRFQKELILKLKDKKLKDKVRRALRSAINRIEAKNIYTRVFIYNDTLPSNSREFGKLYTVMCAQHDAGITVRFLPESKYSTDLDEEIEILGSKDFCLIDSEVPDHECLMLIRLAEINDPDGTKRLYKTAYEITSVDDQKIGTARKIMKYLLSENNSTLFNPGNYVSIADFKAKAIMPYLQANVEV